MNAQFTANVRRLELGGRARDDRPPTNVERSETVYAIAFDMKMEELRRYYSPVSPGNAYTEIKKVLAGHGFSRQQGSVYFGDPATVDAVRTVLAIIDVTKKLPWFSACVADVRMLRIEDNNDLMPAVNSSAPAIPVEPLPGAPAQDVEAAA